MAKKGKINNHSAALTSENRPVRARKYKQFFLVVCEDQATEPAYFEYFKKQFDAIAKETMFFKTIGTGRDPLGVVEQAIQEKQRLKEDSHKEIDFVWAVFDRDDAHLNQTTKQRFEDAFSEAQRNNIQIAYSNEVFELWLLLHFTRVDQSKPIPRKEIYAKLQQAIRSHASSYSSFTYEHGKKDVVEIVLQSGNENDAIDKAKALFAYHQKNNTPPIDANPSTKIHILVQELRDWLRYYKED